MTTKKRYDKMAFGELLVAGATGAAAIARGEMKPAKVIRIVIPTARQRPTHRPPTHAGEMLLEEFLKPLAVTQAEFSRRSGIPYRRLNAIIQGRRGMTADIALRLSRVLATTPDFWLNLQQTWDLWHALRSPEGKQIAKLRPLQTVIFHREAMPGRTDWARVDRMTDDEIRRQIRADPDAAPELDESWFPKARLRLPGRKRR